MRLLLIKLLVLLSLLSSCGSDHKVNWKPNPFVGDAQNASIINSDGLRIYAEDPLFNDYTCFEKKDILLLAANLQYARIPDRYKEALEKAIKDILDQMEGVGHDYE